MVEYVKDDLVCVMRPKEYTDKETGELRTYWFGATRDGKSFKLWPSKKESGSLNLMSGQMPARYPQRGEQEERGERARQEMQQRNLDVGGQKRGDDSNPFD